MKDNFQYQVTGLDKATNEVLACFYWHDMALTARFTDAHKLLEFIERLPHFLGLSAADINEQFIAQETDKLTEELSRYLGKSPKPKDDK